MSRSPASASLLGALALMLALVSFPADALAQARKPRVPPGLDPGGIAVAIATETGIDYTRPEIATRLARDGEGELIGWDFATDDRLPHEPPGNDNSQVGTPLARAVLAEAGAARLVPFRLKRGDVIALGRLVVFSARSPSRIVLLAAAGPDPAEWAAFAEAATHFKSLLIIVPAEPGIAAYPAALGLPNVLAVGAHEAVSAATPMAAQSPLIDVAVPANGRGSRTAAARIAALAARLLAVEPHLEGTSLKSRILSLAKPLPAPHAAATKHGWIAEPQNAFR